MDEAETKLKQNFNLKVKTFILRINLFHLSTRYQPTFYLVRNIVGTRAMSGVQTLS